jgi:hypothetical protein
MAASATNPHRPVELGAACYACCREIQHAKEAPLLQVHEVVSLSKPEDVVSVELAAQARECQTKFEALVGTFVKREDLPSAGFKFGDVFSVQDFDWLNAGTDRNDEQQWLFFTVMKDGPSLGLLGGLTQQVRANLFKVRVSLYLLA